MAKEFGDFQTPPPLVAAVVRCLQAEGRTWTRALEPTCGRGNFLTALAEQAPPPFEIQAIEIQEAHAARARAVAEQARIPITITQASIFDVDLGRDLQWRVNGPLLVIGNPPWVTNSELGELGSSNLPRKVNLKNLRGIDALTGG